MNKIKYIILTLLLIGLDVSGQSVLSQDVFSNSGKRISGGEFSAHATLGQTNIGRSSIQNQQIAAGFWPGRPINPPLITSQLPLVSGAGVATVWNDDVYFMGGATHWWGQTFHQSILKLNDGQWLPVGSIPDNFTWGMVPVRDSDSIYLLDGWNGGAGLLRRYDFNTETWHYLPSSTNWTEWGATAQIVDNHIYLFNPAGHVYEYSIANSSWSEKTIHANLAFSGMGSVVFNDEVYIIGYRNAGFYKYTPLTDSWTRLADPPYQVAGSAVQLYRGKMFCVGGSPNGGPGLNNHLYRSVISYDFASDSWEVEPLGISDGRIFMASVVYDDEIYVFGGFDSLSLAVQTVEKLQPRVVVGIENDLNVTIPQKLELQTNYPNPFNPSTTIRFGLPAAADARLEIYNMLGQRVRVLVNAPLRGGWHSYVWDSRSDRGTKVASGIYLYRLTTKNKVVTKKLMLLK
ncbi:MAG: T9SS type A sorting domain-containing protein [Calditrichota bacterium]